jgi:hypothetical protein
MAVHSVGRGCFFAALAIWAVMVGLIYEPLLAAKSGAILTLLVVCVLLLKAARVTHASYKKTEVWILLGRRIELSPEIAQKLITVTLREVYLRYAFYATLVALMFCGVALVLWLRL